MRKKFEKVKKEGNELWMIG